MTGGGDYPADSFSLLEIDNPDVLLWALKPAEEGIGQGIIVRAWNLSGRPTQFSLGLATGPILSARKTSHIECDLSEARLAGGRLNGVLAPQQFGTYRLMP